MQKLNEEDPAIVSRDALNLARKKVQVWQERNEVMWHQRSKALWLKDEDNNTQYFHMKASQRWKKKRTVKIQDESGRWQEMDERDRVILN